MSVMIRKSSTILGLLALTVAFAPAPATAQSDLDASEASAFMGAWTIAIDSDYGPFEMGLEVIEHEGKVAALMASAEMGTVNITDISKSGEALVLSYEADAQGQVFPVMLQLEPAGEELSVDFNAADGQFMATGTATKD